MKKLLIILSLLLSITSYGTTYYIAANGSSVNNGTSTSTPWSFARFTAYAPIPGDNLLFNRGDVFSGSIVVHSNGTSGNPITYGAYGTGANPVISGFSNLTGWSNLGGNIWETTGAVSSTNYLNLVVINGNNTAMGRTPNAGTTYNYQSHTGSPQYNNASPYSITSSDINSSIIKWTGAELATYVTTYGLNRVPITSASGSTLNWVDPTNLQEGFENGVSQFFIQNDPRTLDQQNEWYYNPSTHKLRIYSVGSPSNVQISTVDTLLNIGYDNYSKTYGNGYDYINIDHVDFTGANIMLCLLRNSKHCTFNGSNFSYSGYDGINNPYWGTASYPTITNCTVNNVNNTAIGMIEAADHAIISNNIINNSGMLQGMNAGSGDFSYTGIASGVHTLGVGTQITNNVITNTGYTGITMRGDYSIADNNYVNTALTYLHDGGGIYTWNDVNKSNRNLQPPTHVGMKIQNNIVVNVPQDEGIYLDDGSNGIEVSGNTFTGCANGIYVHNNFNQYIHDNTGYDNGNNLNFYHDIPDIPGTPGINVYGNILKRNIFFAKTASQKTAFLFPVDSVNRSFTSLDSNYYARPIDDNLTFSVATSGYLFSNYNLAQVKSYTHKDSSSKKSPASISNVNQLAFYYNPTNHDSTVSIITGKDAKGNSFSGSTVLHTFQSLVLIQTASLTVPTISWSNQTAVYGSSLASTQTATAGGVPGTYSYNITGTPPVSIYNNYTVTFTPTDQSTYAITTKTVILTITTASTTLTWLHLTDLIYNGIAQAPTAVSSIPGVQTSVLINGVVPTEINAGSYTAVGGTTNPNYTATTISGTFIINKAITTITAGNTTVNYDGLTHTVVGTTPQGLTLTYSYPDGTPNVPGVFREVITVVNGNFQATPVTVNITIVSSSATIFISDTTKIYTGSPQGVQVTTAYTHSTTYNGSTTGPTAAGNYAVVSIITDGIHTGTATATLTIAKRVANLTWPTPGPIQSGVPIGTGQLSATSDISGIFVYSPIAGTSFNPGDYIISGTFTPTDGANNVGGTITVNLHVIGSPFKNFIINNSIYKSIK